MYPFHYFMLLSALIFSCASDKKLGTATGNPDDGLPAPFATKSSMNFSNVVGWKNGRTPIAPDGFSVTKYADGFENPRWMYVLENGDVLVAETNAKHSLLEKIGAPFVGANKSNNLRKSANRITLLRDRDQNGMPEERWLFLDHLNQPFGMLVLGEWLYVANTDALWRYRYTGGQPRVISTGEKIATLPVGKHNRHWTRNIVANADGTKIYIAVGSGTNIAEHGMEEERSRASILEINPDGTGLHIYASGIRNPVGMGWAPGTNELWAVVNERDGLGDDLVPDYFTHVQKGGFYGWPYMYFGQHIDSRVKDKPRELTSALVPDLALGAHTASLGLSFYLNDSFPKKYQGGAFIAQHGSWNRSTLSGYKVIFVPFAHGKPSGAGEDFLTGFIDDLKHEKVFGRPVGVVVLKDGSLLIADDVAGTVWRIRANR